MIITLVFIPIVFGLYIAYKNTKNVSINKVTINNHPTAKHSTSLNVLQISDMHLENISISALQLYEKIKNEKIDLIALTGDFLDRKKSIPKLIPYLEMFQKVAPKFGTYAIFGNHDYVLRGENFTKLKNTLQQFGCQTLQNENQTITIEGHAINIIGIDDFSTNRSDFAKSYTGIKEGFNFILTHDPNAVLKMKDFHFDYLLSGHFHGGQILYPKAYHLAKMGNLPKMNMIKGLHKYEGKSFYISEGLGQTGVNIRVGSRPEITFHRITIPSASNPQQQVS
ncbi:hypothetical protein HNQ94_001543 [Salirhabdus euzebyi]|uniref:Calcineurin-like phosphoesterase domain-containing protein n=1 Tax=Salirhabdus euzebyi TaxID=394506 RepID=A0A841Q3Y3_9BACI|nr:metallophosphoesterase [Salirhabdus euzebyi]MBB6453095.1 hypothetical protein [Salirhabdus euzebyi]